jgi:hypothetical protein
MRRSGVLLSMLVLTAPVACSSHATDSPRQPAQPPSVAADPEPQPQQPPAVSVRSDPAIESPTPSDPPPPTFGPAELTQLTAEHLQTFHAGVEDEPVPVEIHYVQSNETRHDLYFPHIEALGGAYIGVGSDQNYTMMAAARSEYAFLMDIDYRVVDLHQMYDVFVGQAETPQALVDLWSEAQAQESEALLEQALSELNEPRRRRIIHGFRSGRETVYRHLLRVVARTVYDEPASWLSDPELYAHVRAMVQTDRIRIMSGNLAGADSIQTAGQAARALGTNVEVLYMSNAEEYFKYSKQFVANIDALPIGDASMVLRTIYSKEWEHADLWAYQVHALSDFHTRLQDRKNRSRNPMLRYAMTDGALEAVEGKGFSKVGLGTPDAAGS